MSAFVVVIKYKCTVRLSITLNRQNDVSPESNTYSNADFFYI